MSSDTYAECKYIKRTQPDFTVDDHIARDIGLNFRTIPTFEKGLYEHACVRHYSLQRNELLKCRWATYVDSMGGRVFAPFQFPDTRDLHFYNGAIRFEPSLSLFRNPDFRKKLKPGPGVDHKGQMPIPQELHMKRGGKIIKDGGLGRVSSAKKKNEAKKLRF